MDFSLMIGGEDYSPSAVSRLAWRLWQENIPVGVEQFFLRCKQLTEAENLLLSACVYPREIDQDVKIQHIQHTALPEELDTPESRLYQWWITGKDVLIPVLDAFDLIDKLEAKEWVK